jgi:hypothetical protein
MLDWKIIEGINDLKSEPEKMQMVQRFLKIKPEERTQIVQIILRNHFFSKRPDL